MDYCDPEMHDMLMSAINLKPELKWDTLSYPQYDTSIDGAEADVLARQATYFNDCDALLETLFPTNEPPKLEADHQGTTNTSFIERRQDQFVELEQALARTTDLRKELEIQLAQNAANVKSLEDIIARLGDNNHVDASELDTGDSDKKRSNICSSPNDVGMEKPGQPPVALLSQQQKGYVKVSPFWLGQNLELDQTGCLWWVMA